MHTMAKVILGVLGVMVLVLMAAITAHAQTTVGTNCTISWNANTEVDLGGYRVYATPTLPAGALKTVDVLKPAVSTTCAALGMQGSGTFTIQVDAVDLVGNRSPKTVGLVVVHDATAPAQPTGVTVTVSP